MRRRTRGIHQIVIVDATSTSQSRPPNQDSEQLQRSPSLHPKGIATVDTRDSGELQDRQYELLYDIRRSIRYHRKRRRHFERWTAISQVSSLLLGAATVGTLIKEVSTWAPIVLAATVTTISVISVVGRLADKARLHAELARSFSELKRRIVGQITWSAQDVANWKEEILRIEEDEPPIKQVLNCMADNDERRKMGVAPELFADIDPLQRFFAQFFDLWPGRIQLRTMKTEAKKQKSATITSQRSEAPQTAKSA